MIRYIFILFLVISSCSGGENDNCLTNSVTEIIQDSLNKPRITIASKTTDTIFIHREINKDYYHAIFIDTTRCSIHYDRLTNFEFNQYDSNAYWGNYQYVKEKYPETFKKVIFTELAENWIPVYQYKNNYYLYAPSDWGNAGRRIINDSAFVYWYMDGPLPIPLSSMKVINQNKYVLETNELFSEKPEKNELTIYQIDARTKLSVFKFSNGNEKVNYRLYIPVESAIYFDMVVNYSGDQKQFEFEFDVIDFEKLINNK